MHDEKTTENPSQGQEIQSILTRTGWTLGELAERSGYSEEVLQKAMRPNSRRPLSSAGINALRYAAARDVGGLAPGRDITRSAAPLDSDLHNKLAAIYQRGDAGHVDLLKSLVDVVYERIEQRQDSAAQTSDKHWVSLSVLTDIPAGWPTDSVSYKAKRVVPVEKGRFPADAFGLDVTGDSMDAAKGKLGPILPGETVVLVPFQSSDDAAGKIVAARIDGRTTLKRLVCPADGDCFLRPESHNPEFAGAMCPLDELEIQGVVIGKL